jgi:carbamoyltransferase
VSTTSNIWRLGLGGSDHDFSAVLSQGEDIKVAIEQERITRIKNGLSVWYREPMMPAIDYCVQAEGISLDEIEIIAASDTIPARTRIALAQKSLRLYSHHLCHAASAYMMMPQACKAAIIVYDGYGSVLSAKDDCTDRTQRETISFYCFSKAGPQCLGTTSGSSYKEQDDFPIGISNSVGMFYEVATCVLGYGPMDSGKTMGLAGHGQAKYVEALESFITLGNDLSDCFRCPTDAEQLVECMEQILRANGGCFSARADLAASVQELVHKILLHCVNLMAPLDVDYIGISGGCGLNTVANSKLAENAPGRLPIIIPPHCGDAGLGLGALWLAASEDLGRVPFLTFRGCDPVPALSRPGRLYSDNEVYEAVNNFYPRLAFDPAVRTAQDLATILAAGNIVGVFKGRSEIGPRALGGRSILADPRSVFVRERINRVIKGREPFRPLGPIILSSEYDDYFHDRRNADRYMLKVAHARERCLREAPAAVHVDGTARVQVLEEDADLFLISVLKAFHVLTKVPILINTSFNRRGEPIVETPGDAIDAFLGSGLDGLFLEGRYYRVA